MHFIDSIKLALQNLSRTKFRTFLTILGVIIGISAIVLFAALGLGLQQITSNQIASIDSLTTLTITQTPETASMGAGPALTEKKVEEFRKINGVSKVSESVSLPLTVQYTNTSSGAIVYGIKFENSSLEVSDLKYGRLFNNDDEVIISKALANSFDANNERLIGETIILKIVEDQGGIEYALQNLELKIVGIDNNSTTNLVYGSFDKIYAAGRFDKLSAVKIKVESRNYVDSVKTSIERKGYTVTTIKDLIDQIDKIFLLFQAVLVLIGSIGLLVSSLGIINTMTISLLERTHEIGIMKAIGASSRDIKRLYFMESGLIGFFGGGLGIAAAVLLSNFFNYVFSLFASKSGQHLTLFIVPVNFSILVLVFSILVSLFSGVYPARRAQKLSPMDALRQ